MTGKIIIYVLPNEIIELKELLHRLRKSYKYLNQSNRKWGIHIMLGLLDKTVDWDSSTVSKEWVLNKFYELKEDWSDEHKFEVRENVLGCLDARRAAIKENPNIDYFIWLNTDIVFNPSILYYIDVALTILEENYYTPYFVLTPEIVRVGDSTWDCLVNERFLDKPLGYYKQNNPYADTSHVGEVTAEEFYNNVNGQPKFKFAEGWFTCYTAKLLNHIGLPDKIGSHGDFSIWLIHAMEKLTVQGRAECKQFKLKNIIVAQDYLYRNDNKVKGISIIDNTDEFNKESNRQTNLALQDL